MIWWFEFQIGHKVIFKSINFHLVTSLLYLLKSLRSLLSASSWVWTLALVSSIFLDFKLVSFLLSDKNLRSNVFLTDLSLVATLEPSNLVLFSSVGVSDELQLNLGSKRGWILLFLYIFSMEKCLRFIFSNFCIITYFI